jgi:tRNA U34 5-methylaminomethyl-2-thiouridine-forming methyltransferase MnmC
MWRDESPITKRVMSMNVDGHPRRGRPKKRWMDCVKGENKKSEHVSDRREWKKKTCCADPN